MRAPSEVESAWVAVYVLSFLASLLGAALVFWEGSWAGAAIAVCLVFYLNSAALDVEIVRHRTFHESHPFKRLALWIIICLLFCVAGYGAHQVFGS